MKDLSGLEIKDYFHIFWERRWYFLVVFALVSIGGTIYSKYQPDVYRSGARISVDTPLSTITRSTYTIKDRRDAIREHLSSRTFLEKMIQQTGSYGWGENNNFIMERAVMNVRNNIRIDNVSDRTFIIAFRANDPAIAQSVTNQFAEELIRVSRRSETERTTIVDRFVEGKFAEAEERLKEQSEKIRQYKLRNAGNLPDDVAGNLNAITGFQQQLSAVESAIIQAKNSQETLDSLYEESRKRRAENEELRQQLASKTNIVISKDATPEERDFVQKKDLLEKAETALAQARTKYTENHPDIAMMNREIVRLKQDVEEAWERISLAPFETNNDSGVDSSLTREDMEERRLDAEYLRRSRNIETEIANREQQRAELQKQINDYTRRVRTAPTLEQELVDLLRDEELIKKEYDNYANQKLNAGVATAVEQASDNEIYRVIDAANYPIYPESPNRKEIIMIGLGMGLIIGVAAAFGRELLDNTISSEEEAKKVFNLPVLAAIPSAPKKNKKTELRKTA